MPGPRRAPLCAWTHGAPRAAGVGWGMDDHLIPADRYVTLDNACVVASFVIIAGYLFYFLFR